MIVDRWRDCGDQRQSIYLMLHYYMLIRFFSWMWRGAFLKKRRQTLHCKTTLDALVRMRWRTTLSLLRWPRQACDFLKLVLFPHISQELLLLPFSSGWDASQVSEKQKQRCPSRSRFGADCSGISGSPCYHCNFGFICPSHLKYHMKRIATKEKVLSLLERGDVELSCGSLFQFKLIL